MSIESDHIYAPDASFTNLEVLNTFKAKTLQTDQLEFSDLNLSGILYAERIVSPNASFTTAEVYGSLWCARLKADEIDAPTLNIADSPSIKTAQINCAAVWDYAPLPAAAYCAFGRMEDPSDPTASPVKGDTVLAVAQADFRKDEGGSEFDWQDSVLNLYPQKDVTPPGVILVGVNDHTPKVKIDDRAGGSWTDVGLLVLQQCTFIQASTNPAVCITAHRNGCNIEKNTPGFFIGANLISDNIETSALLLSPGDYNHNPRLQAPNERSRKLELSGDFTLTANCNIYDASGNPIVLKGKKV